MPEKTLKILYLITRSEIGGAQRYILDLASFCRDQGHIVVVASGGDENGELIKRLVKLNIQTYCLRHLTRELNFYSDISVFFDLIKLINKIKPDIVHLNSSKAGSIGALAAKFCGVRKIIYTIHGLVLNEPLPFFHKIFYWFAEWFSAKLKNKLISVSEFDKQSLLKNKITTTDKIAVIHNGLDPARIFFLDKSTALAKLFGREQNEKEFIIGTIANLYPAKGLIYLIEAAKSVLKIYPRTKFAVIGDGPLKSSLADTIIEYGLADKFILAGSLPEANRNLKAFDLFVLPSLKEGLAYALLEASAAGLPIIATAVGGNPEVVKNNFNGLLVPPADFGALAQTIINLMGDPNKASFLASNSASVLKNFSLDQMCEKTLATYL